MKNVMSRKRSSPSCEQVEVLTSQGKSVADAIRTIGVDRGDVYRWPRSSAAELGSGEEAEEPQRLRTPGCDGRCPT